MTTLEQYVMGRNGCLGLLLVLLPGLVEYALRSIDELEGAPTRARHERAFHYPSNLRTCRDPASSAHDLYALFIQRMFQKSILTG